MPAPAPDLRRRFTLSASTWGFLGAVLFALMVFAALPLQDMGLPQLLSVQASFSAIVEFIIPYLAVGGLGVAVGVAEISSTFSDYPREALVTRWSQYLLWLNALTAMLAYLLASVYAPAEIEPMVLIISVGVGFPALIRTKFILARNFGGEGGGDVSVNLGWLYDQFTIVCKKQIDLELMAYRRMKVDQLIQRYTTVQDLFDTALYTLKARDTLTEAEQTAKRAELERIISDKLPPELTRLNLGLYILEVGGVAYVDSMTQMRAAHLAQAGGHEPLTANTVIRELRDLPLTTLTQKALAARPTPEEQAKINQLAAPVPGLPEVTQRASIARYLVDNMGVDAAHALLDE
jgi:hypothetical protein